MRPPRPPSPFDAPPSQRARQAIAAASIVAGSLVNLLPIVANVPYLPPCGLLMLLAWRLRDADLFPSWAALPLGLFDDLVSGQPFGMAMAGWTAILIAIDVIDNRLVWRTFAQDWIIAAGGLAASILIGRLVAAPWRAHVDTVILIQILTSTALYPLAARIALRLDARQRFRA